MSVTLDEDTAWALVRAATPNTARVRLDSTIPPGGIELDVLYDPVAGVVVEVKPWRNLGQFVTAELDRLARADET